MKFIQHIINLNKNKILNIYIKNLYCYYYVSNFYLLLFLLYLFKLIICSINFIACSKYIILGF